MAIDLTGLVAPAAPNSNKIDLSGLAPEPMRRRVPGQTPLSYPAPVPPGQTPFFDQDYFEELQQLENMPLYQQPDSARVYPNQAPELGGGMDFGFGHKLTPEELRTGMVYGIPIADATVGDARNVLRQDIPRYWQGTRQMIGEEFEQLPKGAQILLMDYNYTGVLEDFPKFKEAVMKGDWDKAEKEYTRYMTNKEGNKVPLGTRNTATFKRLQQLRDQEGGLQLGPSEAIADELLNPPGQSGIDLSSLAVSPAGPPGLSPDGNSSSSPESGIGSAGEFYEKYKDTWKMLNPLIWRSPEDIIPLADAQLAMITSGAAMGWGTLKGMGAVVKDFFVGPEKDTLQKMADAQVGQVEKTAQELAYQPRTEKGQEAIDLISLPLTAVDEMGEKYIRSKGGGDKEVNAFKFGVNVVSIVIPGAWKNIKSARVRRANGKYVFEMLKEQEQFAGLPENKLKEISNAVVKALKENPEDFKKFEQSVRELPFDEITRNRIKEMGPNATYVGFDEATGRHSYYDPDSGFTWTHKEKLPDWKKKRVVGEDAESTNIQERILADKLRALEKEAKAEKKSVPEYINEVIDQGSQANVLMAWKQLPAMEARISSVDPVNHSIMHPEGEVVYGKNPNQYDTPDGVVDSQQVKLVDRDVNVLEGAENIDKKRGPVRRLVGAIADRYQIPINAFERFGKNIKAEYYDKFIKKKADAKREYTALRKMIKKDMKQLTQKDREKISIVAHSLQPEGVQALRNMGIDDIPTFADLNPMQQRMLIKYQAVLEDAWFRVNHMRLNTGLKPIGKIDNYFPFVHKLKEMNKHGKTMDDYASIDLEKLQGEDAKFTGNRFPYAQKRGEKAPSAIELDIFDLTDDYMRSALEGIHLNPIAAKAKQAAKFLKDEATDPKLKNDSLAYLLDQWGDHVMGRDKARDLLNQKSPPIAKFLQGAQNNITIATLFGTASTAMKQPLALIGTLAETSLSDVMYGIYKAARPSTVMLKKDRLSKRAFDVNEISQIDIFIDPMAETLSKHGVSGIKKNLATAAAYPMTLLDAFARDVTAFATHRHSRKSLGMSNKEAFQRANDIVTRTQGVGVKGAVSPIQSTIATKWMTLFQTFAINDFNYIARDILGIRNPDINKKQQMARVLKYTLASTLANELFKYYGLEPPKPAPIDKFNEAIDSGENYQNAVADAALELFEVVPQVGGAIKYDSSVLGPVGDYLNDTIPALKAFGNIVLNWGSMSEKQRFSQSLLFGDMLGKSLGIPMTNQIKKMIRTASRTDDPVKIIVGAYIEEDERRKKGQISRTSRKTTKRRTSMRQMTER